LPKVDGIWHEPLVARNAWHTVPARAPLAAVQSNIVMTSAQALFEGNYLGDVFLQGLHKVIIVHKKPPHFVFVQGIFPSLENMVGPHEIHRIYGGNRAKPFEEFRAFFETDGSTPIQVTTTQERFPNQST